MADTIVTNTENSCNRQIVENQTEDTKTTTTTSNQGKTVQETITVTEPDASQCNCGCPCGRFNLDKLAEESRREAFQSSNIVAATSNSIVVFTMLILQEILKDLCRSDNFNIDNVFLVTTALAALGDGMQINNPPPFTS